MQTSHAELQLWKEGLPPTALEPPHPYIYVPCVRWDLIPRSLLHCTAWLFLLLSFCPIQFLYFLPTGHLGLLALFWHMPKNVTDKQEELNVWPDIELTREKAMATHSSTLAWKIPWTEEPGRLQSMGSHRVGHDWSDLAAAAAAAKLTPLRICIVGSQPSEKRSWLNCM